MSTDVIGRFQEVADVAFPDAVCSTVTEEVPTVMNTKSSQKFLTIVSHSLHRKLLGLVVDQVTVVMAAML